VLDAYLGGADEPLDSALDTSAAAPTIEVAK
jgi:hypothetical protein